MKLDNYKISIIMQCFLGEYPNSRKNPVDKFKRAVNSFLNQTNDNSELIIVSDGCQITLDTYNEFFKEYNNIKCIYVEKKDINMYEKVDGYVFYRGEPRQHGLNVTSGSIITYMDSDDFLLPHFTESILNNYLLNKDDWWFINQSWYDNIETKYSEEYLKMFEPKYNNPIKINGLNGEWVKVEPHENMILIHKQPSTLTHLKECDVKWEDSINISEDVLFTNKLIELYKGGFYNNPNYVRCHFKGIYDY